MIMLDFLLIGFCVFLIIIIFFLVSNIFYLKGELESLIHLKRSQSVKYGQLTEQWIPFSENFPFDSQNFRFIGKPIDGLVFDNNKIVFVEFKTNKSSLSPVQKEIKKLVLDKKVDWFELKIN
jgi:predicted Holliday junction resolvase-like endonuclease